MGKQNKTKKKTKRKSSSNVVMSKTIATPMQSINTDQEIPIQMSNPKQSIQTTTTESTHTTNNKEENLSQQKAKSTSDYRWFWSGIVGASLVILVCVFIAWLYPGYNVSGYYINNDPSLLTDLLSSDLSEQDSTVIAQAIQEESFRRKDLLNDLFEQHVIISSDEFASNISNYYNALIAVLSAILIIINLFGFFSWRSNANINLDQKQKEIDNAINGIDKLMEEKVEDIFRKNLIVQEKLEEIIQDIVDQDDHLSDDEWNKIHLLLKQYKKKEILEAINADEQENDGSIEIE